MKAILLTIIYISIVYQLSFSLQKFPLVVTGYVHDPIKEFIITVDGKSVDSIEFKLGDIKLGDMQQKTIKYQVFYTDKNLTNMSTSTLEKNILENNIGKGKLKIHQEKDSTTITLNFTGKSIGRFIEFTTLTVNVHGEEE